MSNTHQDQIAIDPIRTFEITPLPRMGCYEVFSEPKDMVKHIVDGGDIVFEASLITKTMLNTSFAGGEVSFNFNIVVDGFKTVEKSNYCYLSSSTSINHYFKILKNQNKEKYLEYLSHLVGQIEKTLGVTIKQNHFLVYSKAFNA